MLRKDGGHNEKLVIIFIYLEKLEHLPTEKCKGKREVPVAS